MSRKRGALAFGGEKKVICPGKSEPPGDSDLPVTCIKSYLSHLNIIITGNPISITCFTETECNQKISDYVTIDKATTVWNNNSINIVIEKALQATIISLKEGFRYDANILYIFSNVACYDQDEFYDLFKDKFSEYNYALALWTRQYRVITKLIMIDVNFYSLFH